VNLIEFSAFYRSRPTAPTLRNARHKSRGTLGRIVRVSATISKFVSDEKQTRRYFVSGTVQGVGFRFFVQRTAEKLKIAGYARNLYDGRVEVLAVGTPSQLAELRTALERGPRFASVTGVREEEAQRAPLHENSFVIEPDV
jgi:acylphosphatase